jgi:hypothetical protein
LTVDEIWGKGNGKGSTTTVLYMGVIGDRDKGRNAKGSKWVMQSRLQTVTQLSMNKTNDCILFVTSGLLKWCLTTQSERLVSPTQTSTSRKKIPPPHVAPRDDSGGETLAATRSSPRRRRRMPAGEALARWCLVRWSARGGEAGGRLHSGEVEMVWNARAVVLLRRWPAADASGRDEGLITYSIDKHEVLLLSNKCHNSTPAIPRCTEKKRCY